MKELRVLSVRVAVLCLLVATGAFADTIDRISPATINVGNVEAFITLFGTGLVDVGGTHVNFVGPAGSFSVEPSASNGLGTSLQASVPFQVALVTGRYSISVTVNDGTGTRTFGNATLDVIEEVIPPGPPLLGLPELVIAEAESSRGSNVTFTVTATSFVDPVATVSCNHESGALYPVGLTLVSCTATDSIGSTSGSFFVFVVDTVPPVLTLPDDITQTDPVVTFSATAVDAIDGPVAVTCVPPSGSTFAGGRTLVRCTAHDRFFNESFGTFLVTLPGGPTELNLPADMTVEATSSAGAVVTYTATSTDGAPVTCTPPSGSTFPLGTTTVQCSAGNANGIFEIEVRDTTPPRLSPQGNIVVEATGCAGTVATWPPVTAMDIVDGPVEVTCDHVSGEIFPMGITPVQCQATDFAGNTDHRLFTVTVQDTTPPVITALTVDRPFLWPPSHRMEAVRVSVTATDSAGCPLTARITRITSSDSQNGTGDGNTSNDYRITGLLTAELRSEKAGRGPRVYTITVEVADQAGNRTTGTVVVRVTNPNNPF